MKWIILLAVPLQLLAAAPSWAQTFGGYDCTDDCSGHQAGYDWAEENDIEADEDCTGNSQSFIEGCQARVADVEDPDYQGDGSDEQ